MKFKNFIVKDEEIIGVRIEDNGMLHDILYSKLTGITQLELMNLGLLRGINYRNNILTLEELAC